MLRGWSKNTANISKMVDSLHLEKLKNRDIPLTEFEDPRYRPAAILKNRKIVISQQLLDRF